MGSKKEDYYMHVMDELEVIHAENIAIMRMVLTLGGIDKKTMDALEKTWDKRFQEVRAKW